MHKLLHLQQHQHTGKILAHRHTSYRSLFVIVALFSIVLINIQHIVHADQIVVTAKVSAAIPMQPAVITTPPDLSTTDTPIVTVGGTCQYLSPGTIILLYSNGIFLGSTNCSLSGTFSLIVTLQLGSNRLIARTVNITGDYGPDSAPVTVTYIPPVTGVPPGTPNGSSPRKTTNGPGGSNGQPGVPGLAMLSKYNYIVYGPTKDAEWIGSFEGGVLPYTVNIDWGDGTITTQTATDSKDISMSHRYTKFLAYFITVTVTDSEGRMLHQQFAAVTPYVPPITGDEVIPTLIDVILCISLIILLALGWHVWKNRHTAHPLAAPPRKRKNTAKKVVRKKR